MPAMPVALSHWGSNRCTPVEPKEVRMLLALEPPRRIYDRVLVRMVFS